MIAGIARATVDLIHVSMHDLGPSQDKQVTFTDLSLQFKLLETLTRLSKTFDDMISQYCLSFSII